MTKLSQRFLSGILGGVLAFLCLIVTRCTLSAEVFSSSTCPGFVRYVTMIERRDMRR